MQIFHRYQKQGRAYSGSQIPGPRPDGRDVVSIDPWGGKGGGGFDGPS